MHLGYLLDTRPRKIWGAEITATGFNFVIKKALYNYLLESDKFKENHFDLSQIPKNIIEEVVVFNITLPLINYPNRRRDKLNFKALNKCVDQISLVLRLLNQEFEIQSDHNFYLGEDPQLMTISTSYSTNDIHNLFIISAGFSTGAYKLFDNDNIYDADFSECEKITFERYLRLSENEKSKYEKAISNFEVKSQTDCSIYNDPTDQKPRFKIPGKDICLGDPKEHTYDGYLYDCNLESSLQVVTMLTALICFWNNVLNPLYFESLKK